MRRRVFEGKVKDLHEAVLEEVVRKHPMLKPIYEFYLGFEKSQRRHMIYSIIALTIGMILMILSFFFPMLILSAMMFYMLFLAEHLEGRIDGLWKSRYSDDLIDKITPKDMKKVIESLKEITDECEV